MFVYNLRLPGQVHMDETGLRYNYFRDYDPHTGRYVESDPLGIKAGSNTYAYVSSNPLSGTDPFGLLGQGAGAAHVGPRVQSGFCGSGWNFEFVPDGFRGLVSFGHACRKHDECYSECGASKAKCDSELRGNMRSACLNVYSAGGLHFGLGDCYSRADTYYSAVSSFGQGAFDEAQKKCKCTQQ